MDATAALERARLAVDAGAISMIAVELAPLLIDDDGKAQPGAAAIITDIEKLLLNGGLMDRVIANATDGAKQINHVMSVPGGLIYEEMILIISSTSQSFTVKRIAELLGFPVRNELMPDLEAVSYLAKGKQRHLFKKALAGARSSLFTPMPPSVVQ